MPKNQHYKTETCAVDEYVSMRMGVLNRETNVHRSNLQTWLQDLILKINFKGLKQPQLCEKK